MYRQTVDTYREKVNEEKKPIQKSPENRRNTERKSTGNNNPFEILDKVNSYNSKK